MMSNSESKVMSPITALSPRASVCELNDPDTKQWRRDLISMSFSQEEAKQIISIPLSFWSPPDKLVWHWERDGKYSVRSSSHQVGDVYLQNQAGPSTSPNKTLWKEIWHSPLPNRIQNFLWRLGKNILPTRATLRKKDVTLDATCPLCNLTEESPEHLFILPISNSLWSHKEVWFSSPLDIRIPDLQTGINDWILEWLTCKDPYRAQIFCSTLWKVWQARNQTMFKNKGQSWNRFLRKPWSSFVNLIQPIRGEISKLFLFNLRKQTIHRILILICRRDLLGQDNSVSLSVVKDNINSEPLLAEALGIHWGLQLAVSQQRRKVTIPTDAQTVAPWFDRKLVVATINHVILDCNELTNSLNVVKIDHISRKLNVKAHKLVGLARDVGSKTW